MFCTMCVGVVHKLVLAVLAPLEPPQLIKSGAVNDNPTDKSQWVSIIQTLLIKFPCHQLLKGALLGFLGTGRLNAKQFCLDFRNKQLFYRFNIVNQLLSFPFMNILHTPKCINLILVFVLDTVLICLFGRLLHSEWQFYGLVQQKG